MITPGQILAILLAIFLLGAGGYAVYSYKSMATQVAELGPLKAELEALQKAHEQFATEVNQRAEYDQALRVSRQTVNRNLDKVTHEDPVAREFLDERIPVRVREAILSAD